jgi:hypothetical protein
MYVRALLVAVGVVLAAASPAGAGGSFERIIGVGANGNSLEIALRPTGPRSESMLAGPPVPVPRGGFVRLYPLIGGLPADPGRYYRPSHVLCLYWHEPVSGCMRLGRPGIDLLSQFDSLPLRHLAPTMPVEVDYRSHRLRYANGNVFAALELAFERRRVVRRTAPRCAIRLTVQWKGPRAPERPSTLWLAPGGVYVRHRFSRLPRGTWSYLAANLPHEARALPEPCLARAF